MKFSANLGFLWADRPLPDAIRAAKEAGFDAVECHWPYNVPAEDTRSALVETGLKMLGLNTSRGDVAAGENGLSSLPGREADARAAIDEAIQYATAIDAQNIHVMAGFSDGAVAHDAFVGNLRYACEAAASHDLTILIEPLNAHDAPGYFLKTADHAAQVIQDVGLPNLRLMFDCYHIGRTEGDVLSSLKKHLRIVGHIQFAAVPSRGAPDHGDVDYPLLFRQIAALGWDKPLGAEYKPAGPTEASLAWLKG
ncbi:MAG: TIM barrel protein [Pseudomonadota bacterium]